MLSRHRRMLNEFKGNESSFGLYSTRIPQTESAEADLQSKWLPAAKGDLIPMLRMYRPQESDPLIIDGNWTPPAVRPLHTHPHCVSVFRIIEPVPGETRAGKSGASGKELSNDRSSQTNTEERNIDESNLPVLAAFASAFNRGAGLIDGLSRKSLEWASTHWFSVLGFAVIGVGRQVPAVLHVWCDSLCRRGPAMAYRMSRHFACTR
ncbi:MAG: hypothetical protein WBM65_01060 [Sedimenticolaceae bacterium]